MSLRFDVQLDVGVGLTVLVLGDELVVAGVLANELTDLEYERVGLSLA